MLSTLKFALAAMAFNEVSADRKPGSCPTRDQNKPMESFDAISMAGLWFEYVWDPAFAQGYDYKCSTWIVLSDENDSGPGVYAIFNNMLFPAAEEGGELGQDFIRFRMDWDQKTDAGQKARATFKREN